MSSLLTALQTAGQALLGFEKAISVVQNNVLNASTPGYARKSMDLQADAFDPEAGLYGGLETGKIESARSLYAEQSVWQQSERVGYFNELYTALNPLQSIFDLGGGGGLSGAINGLFDAFSSWSQAPNDANSRQNVILAGRNLASQFQMAYEQLAADGESMVRQAGSYVSKINALAAEIAQMNQSIAASHAIGTSDDSALFAKLEELSELANASFVRAADGTYTVLLAGQAPLVVGNASYPIQISVTPSAAGIPQLDVSSSSGVITPLLTGGRLGAELSAYNGTLTSLLGGSTAAGSLNDLATAIVQQVNGILKSGLQSDGVTPGSQLFADLPPGMPAASVISLFQPTPGVDVAAKDLGAYDPSTSTGNGIPMKLAALASAGGTIGASTNVSFTDYLAAETARVGDEIATADSSNQRQAQLLAQAKSMRSDISGVSLDEEAAQLMAFQQSYKATAQVFQVVNEMLDTLMRLAG
jgi:flagellar hook-associated protein 1 FlgK